MNGNVASSPIKNNFLPIIDRWSAVISSPALSILLQKMVLQMYRAVLGGIRT
jgi:hypothetical protein